MNAEQLVESWLNGSATIGNDGTLWIQPATSGGLAEKLQRAYRWICEHAILSPFTDMEAGVSQRYDKDTTHLELYDQPGYSSFVLLPLLNLLTSRRLVFLGAPGRGKTSMATLMALLAGSPIDTVRRGIQHGHPQLTIQDLLGHPLPRDLVQAHSAKEIQISWREWLRAPVKIIDEYNRIPTKTQSALLSLMAEGYAELYEQIVQTGRCAWSLTANDDLGGGTFPVIDALKDRIDVVVRCSPFHSQHLEVLARRIESSRTVEEFIPGDLIFDATELSSADEAIRATVISPEILDLLGFFLGQLDFCRRASDQLEFMNKDTLHLAGRRVGQVCTEDCPLDKHENLCSQTDNGVSPRAFQSVIHFAKALAFFRGQPRVSVSDLRQILPWVLFEKVRINVHGAFFQKAENKTFLHDRVAWLRQMFDRAIQQHSAYQPVRHPLQLLQREIDPGKATLNRTELQDRLQKIRRAIQDLLDQNELNGPVHHDLIQLKDLHTRCLQAAQSRPGHFG